MAKQEKRLTRKQRQVLFGKGPAGAPKQQQAAHIHCIACGRHLDADEFDGTLPRSQWLTCEHGSRFAACSGCVTEAQARIDEHDRTGQPPRVTAAWH